MHTNVLMSQYHFSVTGKQWERDQICCALTGESEKRLREAFEAAHKQAQKQHPTLIFLDELDSIAPLRSSQQPHEARVVAQLLTLLDGAVAQPGELK